MLRQNFVLEVRDPEDRVAIASVLRICARHREGHVNGRSPAAPQQQRCQRPQLHPALFSWHHRGNDGVLTISRGDLRVAQMRVILQIHRGAVLDLRKGEQTEDVADIHLAAGPAQIVFDNGKQDLEAAQLRIVGVTAHRSRQRSASANRFVASRRNETTRSCSSIIEPEKRSSTAPRRGEGNSMSTLSPARNRSSTSVLPPAITATAPSQAGYPAKKSLDSVAIFDVAKTACGASQPSGQMPWAGAPAKARLIRRSIAAISRRRSQISWR